MLFGVVLMVLALRLELILPLAGLSAVSPGLSPVELLTGRQSVSL